MAGPVLPLTILFAALSDAAYAGVVGCLMAIRWLNDPAGDPNVGLSRSLTGVYLASVAALIVSHLVRPWFAAAGMSGSEGFAANLALVPAVLSSTHFGKVWYISSIALAALVFATLLAARRRRRVAVWLFVAALVLMAAAKAASGHASGNGDFTLAEFAMLLHVVSIAVWAGTVIASGLFVLPGLPAQASDFSALWRYGKHLSKAITWAVPAVFLSGICVSYRDLNGVLSGLWLSGWGKILIAKLTLVALALTLGALARFRCVQCPPAGDRAALMVRLVRTEAVVMVLILCISGVLANTAPADTAR